MSKTECELLLKQMETKLDDLQVKWAKHQKDISDRMKTAVSDLTKSGTADRQDISQLTTKINEIQLKVSDGSDHGSGINFRAFSDENSDPSAWWRDFENCAEFKKYSEEKQLSALKVLLKGSAGVWLDRTLTNDIPDTDSCAEKLKKIKKAFIDKFEKNNTWLDEHLIHFMSQRPHEPVQKYYSRLMTKVARLDKTPQEILVIFVKGLRHQLKYYVLSREPGELEAAFKLAKSAESLIEISDVTGGNEEAQPLKIPGEVVPERGQSQVPRPQHTTDRDMLTQLSRLRGEMGRLREEIGKVQRNNDRTGTIPRCRYCNIPGHTMRDCRSRMRDLQLHRTPRAPPHLVYRDQRSGPRPMYHPPNGGPAQLNGNQVGNRPLNWARGTTG